MMIVVLGPDGVGKTTLAKKLSSSLEGLTYLYFGDNINNRQYVYFSNFLKKQKEGKFNILLRYLFIFINDVAYYKKAKKSHIISDRCPIDRVLGTKLKGNKFRHIYHKWSQKLMPKPDFAILLEGDSNIIYNRKKEVSVNVIENYISFYNDYLKENKIKNIRIDTTKNNLTETVSIAIDNLKRIL